MIRQEPPMFKKMRRVLRDTGDLYTLIDIINEINAGRFQSFVRGDTWVITQVHQFPRRTILEIAFVVGDLAASIQMLSDIEAYARSVGADRITGMGRKGWEVVMQPGWKQIGAYYAKDL